MLKYGKVCFESFGYVLPEVVVTSAELERELAPVYAKFGVHEGRLELMSGVRERRFWEEGVKPSDAGARAGQRALEASGVEPGEIECLLHTSVSRDCLEPATAAIVHDNLKLSPKAVVYDISNACLGFLNGVISLANMIELGQVKRGLIVAAESSRNLVQTTVEQLRSASPLSRQDFKAAFASLTIGSGAVALVMSHESVSKFCHRLLGGVARTATEHNHLCRGSEDTGFHTRAAMSMVTHAEALLESGCTLACEAWNGFKRVVGWSNRDVDRTYCHQVGTMHRDRLLQSLQLDAARDFTTYEVLGNVGSASLPLTMAMGIERDPPKQGERIGMLGIGSGLSSVMLGLRW